MKATMTLRTLGSLRIASGLRHRSFRLPVFLAFGLVVLTLLTGASGAGVAQYTGTLYLDGSASGVGSGSYQLSVTAPPAQGAAPTALAGVSGSGGPSGSFVYVYVVNSGGVLTASPLSNTVSPTNATVTVSGIPAGADLYRQQTSAGAPNRQMILIASGVGPVYSDTTVSASGPALPQSDNRAAMGATGWFDFAPGSSLLNNSANTMGSSTLPAPSACTGWVVDGGGGVSLPAGTWTVTARVRSGSQLNGVAVLSVGAYVVNASGSVVSTVFGPTDGAQQIQNVVLPGIVATVSATTSAPTNIGSSEHLCLMFWRHQTTAYTNVSANRFITLVPYDPSNAITIHPAPNSTPTATLSSPADGLHTTTTPTLGATYTDAEPDPGNITFRICTDSNCSSPVVQSSSALAATNGSTATWPPSSLAEGTYYWQAQASDSVGTSAWTSSRSFVVDTTAPATSIDASPGMNSNASSGSFAFSANESVTGYQCKLDAGSFAACSSPAPYGPVADGSHTFSVKATADLAGNPGTTTSYPWTIDTVPPNTSLTSSPTALSNSSSPSFGLSATQSGSTFECKLDAGAFAACSSPKAYSGVADGAHTFQARAIDPAGNVDSTPVSYAWTIDATPPDTTIGPSQPLLLTTATGATFDFTSNEGGSTFSCSLDSASFTSCSTPKTYSALPDGTHTFQVRATDTAANSDSTPASYTWAIDTTPPVTAIGPTTPPAHTSSASVTFDLSSNEGGSTFVCSLDGGSYIACSTPQMYAGLADGAHSFDVRATDPAGNVDTSPASYSWNVDHVAPGTPSLVSPADAALVNGVSQLRGTFDDATTGGDTGTVDFQICSSSAPAGAACAPLVQSSTSASLAAGGTASWSPTALADGTYHWQARAKDAAGNQSAWSATRSFQLDTSVPTVPATPSADDAWMKRIELKATFSKPAFAGTGELEFRVCSDAMCLGVVRSGSSGTMVNGSETTWSPASQPGDGLWYWQVRAHDSAGNVSAWSPSRVLHLDSVAPGKPGHFNGVVADDGLTLRWEAPNDVIANYVVFVDGAPWKNLGSTEYEVKLGAFGADDRRTFAVVAVDLAGNVGTMSPSLIGVPNLVGLSWAQAQAAVFARGLHAAPAVAAFAAVPMFVQTQDPPAPSLVEQGSAVNVTLAAVKGARLAVRVRPGAVKCARGCTLRLRVELSSSALVHSRLLSGRGRLLNRTLIGSLHAGANTVRIKLPGRLGRGAYRLVFDAKGESGVVHASVHVRVN
ncbi:MAG: Ig-like domain-containing protein [Gaiellaceae bacterium]